MQQRFLLQILLLAQHVSGTTTPIIRSSRVLYSGCCLWYFVLWFSSCWSGMELRVMCPVCRMLCRMWPIRQHRYLYQVTLTVVRSYYNIVRLLTLKRLNLKRLLSSSLLSKKLKIKIYRTIILPVVLYGCETWSLTLREECRLRVF